MTVQLSSLRIAADFDETKYVEGMNAKVRADQAGTSSSKQLAAEMAKVDVASGRSGSAVGRLSRSYVDGYGTAARFHAAVGSLQRQVELGNATAERAGAIYQGLVNKYRMVADATDVAAQGNAELAAVMARVNATADLNALETSGRQIETTAFAVQDLGAAFLSGQPSMTTFINSGQMIARTFGGAGVTGIIKGFGASLLSFVTNPVNIAIVAFAGLAMGVQALIGWLSGGEAAADRAAIANDRLAASVARVRDGYDEASGRILEFGQDVSADAIRTALQELETLQQAFRDVFADHRLSEGAITRGTDSTLDPLSRILRDGATADEIADLQGAMDRLAESVAAGTPNIIGFRNELAEMATTAGPAFASVLDAMRDVTAAGDDGKSLMELAAGIAEAIETLGNMGKEDLRSLASSFDEASAAAAKFIGEAFGPQLTGLDATIEQIRSRVEALRLALMETAASPVVSQQQRAEAEALVAGLRDAEAAAIRNATAIDAAREQTARFSSAMGQLQGVAVGSLSAGASAAYAFRDALAAAANQGDRLLAVQAALNAAGRMIVAAQAGVTEYISTLEREAEILAMPDLQQAITRNLDTQADALAAIGQALTDEDVQRITDATTAVFNLSHAATSAGGGGGAGGGGRGGGAVAQMANEFDQATAAAQRQIESIEQDTLAREIQIATMGMAEDAAAALRFEMELAAPAMADGTASAAELAEIAALVRRFAGADRWADNDNAGPDERDRQSQAA